MLGYFLLNLEMLAVTAELQRLVDSGMTRFYMGHGGPLKADQVQKHIVKLKNKSDFCSSKII